MHQIAVPIIEQYLKAKALLKDFGYAGEIAWQANVCAAKFTESDLLREAAWVILCSGFRERIVRRCFDFISLCFCDWESASSIIASEECCVRSAAAVFNNQKKLWAIVDVARRIESQGFERLSQQIRDDPIRELSSLQYVGPVTACHLAKNLGFAVAKNDRHLQRLATDSGFRDAERLCGYIADVTGDPIPVVDIVLWRMCVIGLGVV